MFLGLRATGVELTETEGMYHISLCLGTHMR